MTEVFEDNYVKYEVKDDVFWITYKGGYYANEEVIKHMITERLKLLGERVLPVVVEIKGILGVSKDGRALLKKHSPLNVDKIAFVSKNTLHWFVIHLFVRLSKLKAEYKIFDNEKEAASWVKQPLEVA